jgi:3alpha(or 20beta)-hydroxysteroid dehydrogenase
MSARLAGKTALITGGARGQGAAHGRRLAEEGACVLLADILDDLGVQHARDLQAAGHNVHFLHHDVTHPQHWNAAVQAAEERFGHLDVLVNNAGVVRAEAALPALERRATSPAVLGCCLSLLAALSTAFQLTLAKEEFR